MRKKADSGGSDSVATVVAKKPKKKHKLPPAKKKKLWKAAGAVICLIVAVVFIYSGLMNVNSSFQRAKNSAYNGIYQRAYDSAERRNHVSNYALLSIEDVREISRMTRQRPGWRFMALGSSRWTSPQGSFLWTLSENMSLSLFPNLY